MSEHDANKALADTARMRFARCDGTMADPLEATQPMTILARRMTCEEARRLYPRERRKPSTVDERETRAAVEVARDVFAARQQQMIEEGIWPVY